MNARESDSQANRSDYLLLPTLTNSPLKNINDKQNLGKLRLRKNIGLDFLENSEFDSELLTYDGNYQNSLIYSDYFVNHMNTVIDLLKSQLPENSKVVEVGCGKGDFLEMLNNDRYFNAIGFDATYEGDSNKIIKRYLNEFDRMEADLVVLRHVIEHVKKPHAFLKMLKTIFGKGLIYIEVPNYVWILENKAFFDINYEHVNYFSQKSLTYFFNDEEPLASLCFNDQYQSIISKIELISNNFERKYIEGPWEFVDFYSLFPNMKDIIIAIEKKLRPASRVYIWGAASKGCMFLAHCKHLNVLLDRVNFAIDINPKKQNKFLPISLVPIKSKEEFYALAQQDDLVIITNPNYKSEITKDLDLYAPKNLNFICL